MALGSHPTKNTYKIYFLIYIIDNQVIILSKIISINLQRNFYSNKIHKLIMSLSKYLQPKQLQ